MRKPRLEYQGAWYHVIARGNQRQRVFQDDGDYVRYLKVSGGTFRSCGFKLFAYCLMPNHVHLLVRQETLYPLSRAMQRIQSAYTAFYNKKHGKPGHLFQGRYKSIVVDADSYLKELVRYIHLNPWRAKLEDGLGEYPWNSHRQYLGKDRQALASVDTKTVLRMFSKAGPIAKRLYQKYLAEGMDEGHREDLYDLRNGRILGNESFEETTYKKAAVGQTACLKLGMSLEQIWKAILEREGILGNPSGRKRTELMLEVAYWAVESAGMSRKEAAVFFGVEPSTITRGIQRLESRWGMEPVLRRKSEQWVRSL